MKLSVLSQLIMVALATASCGELSDGIEALSQVDFGGSSDVGGSDGTRDGAFDSSGQETIEPSELCPERDGIWQLQRCEPELDQTACQGWCSDGPAMTPTDQVTTCLCAGNELTGYFWDCDQTTCAAPPASCSLDVNESGVAVGLTGDGCYPRCSADTAAAIGSCGPDFRCAEETLAADTTPPVIASDETVDCSACVAMSNQACLFAACPEQAAALADCRSDGADACSNPVDALLSCMNGQTEWPSICRNDPCFGGGS